MLDDIAIRDLAVIGELCCIFVQKPDGKICQRQDRFKFMGRAGNSLLPRVHAPGATKLKEIGCEALLLERQVKARCRTPHCFFEPCELCAV